MSDENRSIEPGERFTVGYGNEKKVEVVALGLRGQKKLADIVQQLIDAEENGKGLELFTLAESALRVCMPDLNDEFLDTIDAEYAMEIATNALGKQSLTESDRKKSE